MRRLRILLAGVAAATLAACSSPDAGPASQPLASQTPTSQTPTSVSALPTTGTSAAPADPEANPTSTAPVSTVGLKPAAALPGTRKSCRTGNPLANVYHPYRLQVVARCSTVAGTVETIRHEDDGDVHIDLAVDTAYREMLDAGNRIYQHGWLVLELVPADQSGCAVGRPPRPATGSYDYGICTGADEAPPRVGQHIWVTGPYVIDHWHNWAEIHPVWSMTTARPTGSVALVRTSPAPSPTTAAKTHLGCSATMSNAHPTQYSTTTVIVTTGVPGASVTATAHYKSTTTTNTAPADSSGVAHLPFRISRATIGYQVEVSVTAQAGTASATCSTSFTPV